MDFCWSIQLILVKIFCTPVVLNIELEPLWDDCYILGLDLPLPWALVWFLAWDVFGHSPVLTPLHTSDHPVLPGSRALAVSDTSLACRTPRSSSVLHYWFVTICRCFQWSKLEMNEWMSLVYLCGWGDMCVCACDGQQPQGCQPAPLGQVLIGLELTQWTRLLGDGAWAVFLSLPLQSWITIMCAQHFLPSFWWLDSVLRACEAREHFINWTISLVFTF